MSLVERLAQVFAVGNWGQEGVRRSLDRVLSKSQAGGRRRELVD